MHKTLRILYRGPLSSCNYGCTYCPFAKHNETAAEHRADAVALNRFVDWVTHKTTDRTIGILFTPWGEALHHRRYQQAFSNLTQLSHVEKVAIQTNLACRFDWLSACNVKKAALWATFHPTETTREAFVEQVMTARAHGVAVSVGVVGLREHEDEIQKLRDALPPDLYVWINAYKRVEGYYSADLLKHYTTIDPLFPLNTLRHPSADYWCNAGESVVSIDGDGNMRRCHFIREPLANIYHDDWRAALQPRTCTNTTCGCHIGYVHLPHLNQRAIYGDQILERIPVLPNDELRVEIPIRSPYVSQQKLMR